MMAWILVLSIVQETRDPIPEPAAQAEAEKLVREVFKDEYAGRDKAALAKNLYLHAMDTSDDKTARYVLLREARDLASQNGDPETALNAAREIADSYAVDGPATKSATVAASAKSAKTPEAFQALARLALQLAEECAQVERFELAVECAAAAVSAARKSKDVSLSTKAETKQKEFVDLKARFDRVRAAREKLAGAPDDPRANQTLGEYLCLLRGKWADGLPHLAKGTGVLPDLARKELAQPADSKEQIAIGDGWWDWAEKESGAVREEARRHAGQWYEKTLSSTTGLTRTKIEKRLNEVQIQPPGTWIDITDPKLFGRDGKVGEAIEVVARPDETKMVELQKFPSGDFDGLSVRVRPTEKMVTSLGFDKVGRSLNLETKSSPPYIIAEEFQKGSWKNIGQAPCTKREYHILSVILDKGDCVYYVDGEAKLRLPIPIDKIKCVVLKVDRGSARFDQIKLRKKS